MSSKAPPPSRRLAPEARRRQLIEATRTLIAEHPEAAISTADVAKAAGVTRALVHHYFKGIAELRQAVALDIAQQAAGILAARPGGSLADRVRANVNAFLDALDANGHVWFATIGAQGDAAAATPAGRALRRGIIEQMIRNNAEIIDDTPWTRLCLTGYLGFSDAVCRRWVSGEATRDEAEQALVDTLLHLLTHTIPRERPAS